MTNPDSTHPLSSRTPTTLERVLRIAVCCFIGAMINTAAAQKSWKLVWSDEFDRPNGSSPDSSKWGFDTGAGGWGNNELQYYTTRTNNARIENGHLVIEVHKENFAGSSYTSARLLTKGKASWTHVRVEGRIKVPKGQGIWPAFWMLGTNIDSVKWPNCGEIDIMENIGREPSKVHGTIHGPGYSGGNGIGGSFSLPAGKIFADDFHVFAIEWETNRIRWFVDGQPFFTVTPGSLPSGAQWVFDKPEFLLLNVAVGGNWPGYPDTTTVFPQRMVVDYVRVYEPSAESACGGNVLTNPGFELVGLANWLAYGNGANTQLAHSNSLPVYSGSNSFKVYGQFVNSDNYSGLYQDIPCSAGATFTADAWAITPANDRIAGNNTAWAEVTFRNQASSILGIYRSAPVNASTPPGAWVHLQITNRLDPVSFISQGYEPTLVAPSGTAFVRYQVVFRQQNYAAGAVMFDDLRLEIPGPPEIPLHVFAGRNGASLNLSFPTSLHSRYQVRYKSELGNEPWLVLSNVVGTGTLMSVADLSGAGSRFYRVDRLCP